jgi:hypothetical protein
MLTLGSHPIPKPSPAHSNLRHWGQICLIDNWMVVVPRHVPHVHAHREPEFKNGELQPATPQGTFSLSASVHESSRSLVASRTAFTNSAFTAGAECPHS